MNELLPPELGLLGHARHRRTWLRGTISVPATVHAHTPAERTRWHGKPPTPAAVLLWRPAYGAF